MSDEAVDSSRSRKEDVDVHGSNAPTMTFLIGYLILGTASYSTLEVIADSCLKCYSPENIKRWHVLLLGHEVEIWVDTLPCFRPGDWVAS